jgi:hypothetical protein
MCRKDGNCSGSEVEVMMCEEGRIVHVRYHLCSFWLLYINNRGCAINGLSDWGMELNTCMGALCSTLCP